MGTCLELGAIGGSDSDRTHVRRPSRQLQGIAKTGRKSSTAQRYGSMGFPSCLCQLGLQAISAEDGRVLNVVVITCMEASEIRDGFSGAGKGEGSSDHWGGQEGKQCLGYCHPPSSSPASSPSSCRKEGTC